jgi:hypothetical protein
MDKALFAWTEDAEVPPVDLDNAVGKEGPLADLTSLLDSDGFDADSIAVREHPFGG